MANHKTTPTQFTKSNPRGPKKNPNAKAIIGD